MNENQEAKTVMSYVFPKGYIMQVTLELWADGEEKQRRYKSFVTEKKVEGKEKLELVVDEDGWKAECKKHEAVVKFDLGGCTLRELIQKLITTSNSPRVAWQNATRPKYTSDAELENAFGIENGFTFTLKDWVENARQKLTDEEKAERKAKKAISDLDPEVAEKLLKEFMASQK